MPVRKEPTSSNGFFSLKRRKSPDSSDASSEQRRRITIACVRCRHRKIRCDGSDPCNKCKTAGTDCQYYAVTKEENQAAREKKALAKANRTKPTKLGMLPTKLIPRKDEKKTFQKPRSVKQRRMTMSPSSQRSATPEPAHHHNSVPLQPHGPERPHLHIEPAYTLPPIQEVPYHPVQVHETGMEHDDTLSTSDSTETYFGYLSSSTTSLQSNVYDPAVYAQQEVGQYIPMNAEYPVIPAGLPIEPTYYPGYAMHQADTKVSEQPLPLSYPMDSPHPSGLCLYLSPDEPVYPGAYASYTTVSNPTTPSLPHTFAYPAASPPLYHGPIDWNSRPLAPFQGASTAPPNSAQYYARARSYSDLPIYTQTVSLDQVCSAGI